MTVRVYSLPLERLEDLLSLPRAELIEAIRSGLPADMATALGARLVISQEELALLLGLASRTLQRRLEQGQLELAESERVWDLARIFFRAVEALEGEDAAIHWFKSPVEALARESPLVVAQTVVGRRDIENVLGRIEHGVFS